MRQNFTQNLLKTILEEHDECCEAIHPNLPHLPEGELRLNQAAISLSPIPVEPAAGHQVDLDVVGPFTRSKHGNL